MLVVKGFHQVQGIDYTESFSPIIKSSTIRVILSLVVMNKWILRQVDINNAFLNGYIIKAVYMQQPKGFIDSTQPNHIFNFHKALYGLKQATRAWFDRLKMTLTQQWGFNNSKSNTSLFFKRVNDHILIFLVNIDDIVVIGLSPLLVTQVIFDFQSTFALKDLEELNYFLGIQVIKNSTSLLLSQYRYIADLLAKVNIYDSTPYSTPMASRFHLTKNADLSLLDVTLYISTIGALQYITLTRPEIAFLVNRLS